MGTADNAMGGATARGNSARRMGQRPVAARSGSRWTAFEILAMVLGFIVFWPIGLAILGYKFWQRRYGGPDLQTLADQQMAGCAHDDGLEFDLEFPVGLRPLDATREPLLFALDRQCGFR